MSFHEANVPSSLAAAILLRATARAGMLHVCWRLARRHGKEGGRSSCNTSGLPGHGWLLSASPIPLHAPVQFKYLIVGEKKKENKSHRFCFQLSLKNADVVSCCCKTSPNKAGVTSCIQGFLLLRTAEQHAVSCP